MPELPDVERFKRIFDETARGKTVARATVADARILEGVSAPQFVERLRGVRFLSTRRHGKHLLVALDRGGWLTLHFGMTGALRHVRTAAEIPPFTRVAFDLAGGGQLAYVNKRMLGRVGLADDADAFVAALGLGPDALDPRFDLAAFRAALAGRRRDVKTALMDQSVLAGIGNIYADEILFQARIHPRTPVDRLRPAQQALLFRQIKKVLAKAIERGAGAEDAFDRLPRGYLLPHRDKDGRCPRCGTGIATLETGGRTSYYCPRCQPEPGG